MSYSPYKIRNFDRMKTIHYNEKNIDTLVINDLLQKGGVIGFPTETVYGLGAFISNEEAIRKIYALKNRPEEKAMIVHIGKIEQVYLLADDIPEDFFLLSSRFLPGPLTIILKKKNTLSRLVSSYDTVAIRYPSHKLALKLLNDLEEPIVGTSANISNQSPALSSIEVVKYFEGKIDCIIDGGKSNLGLPSTILSLVGEMKILRVGSITKKQLEQVIKKPIIM